MQEIETLFPQDLYLKHLTVLGNIHFTSREIDVMSCIVSARRTSKIASFLSINPRTVETHIRNIMLKLECNSQEGIIDFIESSDKLSFFKKYYALLRMQIKFEKSLTLISKLNREKGPLYFFIQGEVKDAFVSHLADHLKLSGIRLSSTKRKRKEDDTIFMLPKTLKVEEVSLFLGKIKHVPNKTLVIVQERKNYKDVCEKLMGYQVIDFGKKEGYYFSFFSLLKKLIPTFNFDEIISEFEKNSKEIYVESQLPDFSPKEKASKIWSIKEIKRVSLFLFLLVIILGGAGFLSLSWYQRDNQNIPLRSDLILPTKSLLLDRVEILNEIDAQFKGGEEIQIVALMGPGGAGKTTLARHYAHQKKENSIWEINAETRESLNLSFENLAQALAKTELDQKILKEIQEIKEGRKKEDSIIGFVKERLHSHSNWLLIYDNVLTFESVQKYLPRDSDTWGPVKIILTTRDSNIGNNEFINHSIVVGELSFLQKLTLFTKIMTHDNGVPFTDNHVEAAKIFLEKIPSFPLDISIAAYYLKATNTPYSLYLKNLEHFDKDFTRVQESILREAGEYTSVRYSIIVSSLKKILENSPEFEDLLLILILLDSQNIPRDLLNNIKDNNIVSDFIFNLKKYSLLTSESSSLSGVKSFISIHRSTQAITLSYLLDILGLEKNKEGIENLSEKLVTYIDKVIKEEDYDKMKSLINHCEVFLKHKNLLSPSIEGVIKGQLGIIYYFLGDNIKAKSFFEESLAILEKFQEVYPTRIALFKGYLGNTLRDLGDYEEAKMLIETAIHIYEKHYPKEILKHAYFVVYLGIIERILGRYDAARKAFKKGVVLHKDHFPENKNYAAWVSGQLGVVDREIGEYEEARKVLETSLKTFKKDRSPDHLDLAWALDHLGVVYAKLGEYEKAREAFEKSLKIYAVYLPDQVGPRWILAQCESSAHENSRLLFDQLLELYKIHFHDNYIYLSYPMGKLGNLYGEMGNYEKAKILLNQTLSIYQKNYGESHLTVGQVLSDLGKIYLLADELEESETLLKKSLKILEKTNHPDIFLCLERLSDLFLKKSMEAMREKEIFLSENFKKQSFSFLKKAEAITIAHFGKDAFHTLRIKEKLKEIRI